MRKAAKSDRMGRGVTLVGYLGEAEVHHSRRVPQGVLYVTGRKVSDETGSGEFEDYGKSIYPGYLLEESKLHCMSTDDQSTGEFGFTLFEEVGIAVDPRAVQRVRL